MGDMFWYVWFIPWDTRVRLAELFPCVLDFRQSCG